MIDFSVYESSTGRVLRSGAIFNEEQAQHQVQQGEALYLGLCPVNTYIAEGAPVEMGARPDANHVFNYATKDWHDPRTLAEVKAAQIGVIDAAFESSAQALTAGYPPTERSTWFMQQSEALAWGADNTKPTPYLDGIAQARGIAVTEMRQKTLGNVQLFMAASQFLIGTRQALRDQIAAATNESEVTSINWPAQ